jgi:signal transduction histidine kinase
MGLWRVGIKPVYDLNGIFQSILIQAFDLSALNQRFNNLQKENQNLQEMALRPSHILRSPLSSMLGLLDLIDQKQLDPENQKYFSYLKPLAKELDNVIRSNAKKMSALN